MAGKFFKYLPKSASFSVPNHTNIKSNNKLFSGPIVMTSMIPDRYCRRRRNDMFEEEDDDEPGSPKVSCIGQVNPKKDKKMAKSKTKKQLLVATSAEEEKKRSASSVIHWMFGRRVRVDASRGGERALETAVPREAGKMRKYASGREALKDFDWRAVSFGAGKEEEEEDTGRGRGGGFGAEKGNEYLDEGTAWAPPVPLQVK